LLIILSSVSVVSAASESPAGLRLTNRTDEARKDMMAVYTKQSARYRGVSYVMPISAAKEAVAVEDLAERLSGRGVRRGREIAFLCPLHDDHNPSLRVNRAKGVWYCDPCLRGGSVVDLARLAWGYDERDAHIAAAEVLMLFGHEVPQRPPAWFRKQHRQRKMRDLAEQAWVEAMTRRLWKYVFAPIVDTVEDADDRAEMARELLPAVEANAKDILKRGTTR
jgi:CHC2 zinc finger